MTSTDSYGDVTLRQDALTPQSITDMSVNVNVFPISVSSGQVKQRAKAGLEAPTTSLNLGVELHAPLHVLQHTRLYSAGLTNNRGGSGNIAQGNFFPWATGHLRTNTASREIQECNSDQGILPRVPHSGCRSTTFARTGTQHRRE